MSFVNIFRISQQKEGNLENKILLENFVKSTLKVEMFNRLGEQDRNELKYQISKIFTREGARELLESLDPKIE